MANSPSGESVIHRVARVLAVFGPDSGSMSVRQLAREVDLPVSTVHRLLSDLEAEGLMQRGEDGRWRHGTRLWEITFRGSPVVSLREAALPFMEDLAGATGRHVSLAILDGGDVLYLERLRVDNGLEGVIGVAARYPAHATSAGLVLVAFGTDRERETLLNRRLTRVTDATITDRDRLRVLLAEIRRDGYANMPGLIVEGVSGTSVPVLGTGGTVVAALTVMSPIGQERLGTTVPQLTMAAAAISRRLGRGPEFGSFQRFSQPTAS